MSETTSKQKLNDLWVVLRWVPLIICLILLSAICYHLWNMELNINTVEISLTRPTPTPKPYVTIQGSLKDWAKAHP